MKLLILGHPPLRAGGVSSMLRILYPALANTGSIKPTILCAVQFWPDDVSWESGEVFCTTPEVRRFMFDQFDTLAVRYHGRTMLGQVELLAKAFDAVHEKFDAVQVVSGANLLALGPARANRKFVLWLATTLDDENSAVQRFGFGWKSDLRVLHYYLRERNKLRKYERLIFERCDSVCSISPATEKNVRELFGVPGERSKIVLIPVPDDILNNSKPDPIPGRLLSSGRLHDPRKDLPTLLEAMAIVRKQSPEARLVLMGSDSLPPKAVGQIERLNLKDSVEVTGHLKDHMVEYRKADVVVISSLQEGLNITGLEGLAHGAPVISTKCGGPEAYVIDGKTGFLVPTGDSDAMAGAILKVLQNRDLRNRMGKAGCELVNQEFSSSRMIQSFKQEYERVFGFTF